MSRVLFSLAIIALLAWGTFSLIRPVSRPVQAIRVVIQDETGGGANYLPEVDGFVSGHGHSIAGDGTSERYQIDESYKVIASAPGHFFVVAHYVIERGGVSTEVDRALPIWDKKPAPSNWSKLDSHLVAFAYMSDSTISY